ncbi:MAG TPA: HAD-IA family hydrolase [Candidatus Methylomirabilis sp.]|nr:HAD-IA family hydrolase [Candidatus Methylomirabilis sp.]
MPKGQVILFDLGGVLIESSGRDTLRTLLPDELERDQVLDRWIQSPIVKQFERGLLSPEAFAAAFINEWRLPLGPAEFLEVFATWPKGFFAGAKALVRALRTQHRVACLSNTNSVHWERVPELPTLFDASFPSHLTGFLKPEREAYDYVLGELGVEANAVYFFDDLLPNIVAARAIGMNAFHVRGFSDIAPTLRVEGLYA